MQLPQLLPLLVLPLAITLSTHPLPSSSDISPQQISSSAPSISPSPIDHWNQPASPGRGSLTACPPRSHGSNSSDGCPVGEKTGYGEASGLSSSADSNGLGNSSTNSSILSDEESEIDKKGEGGRGSSTKCWFSCSSDGAGAARPGRGLVVGGLIAGCALL
jgi:hypothetical protein